MNRVRITNVTSAHPGRRVRQEEAVRLIAEMSGDGRRAAAVARGTKIETRAIALSAAEIMALGTIESRNLLYHKIAPGMAFDASSCSLADTDRDSVGCIVTSSCTGYSVPGWGATLIERHGLRNDTVRVPLTESGCGGGVVALACAADYVAAHRGRSALVVAAEVCSLAFHATGDDGNLMSSLIFGDGAGAALLEPGHGRGLEILDSSSTLIPNSRELLGFDLTDRGFYPVLRRELVARLVPAAGAAVQELLARNCLGAGDIGAWLLHPGGARILCELEAGLGLEREKTRWSWDSMREFGNTSSAAIFDVIRRYNDDTVENPLALVAAFGPGVAIELLLVRRS